MSFFLLPTIPLQDNIDKLFNVSYFNLLTNTNEFKVIRDNYHFYVAVDMEDRGRPREGNGVTYMDDPKEIKPEIEKIENDIRTGKIKKDNLIILSGNRLQLGISLRNVDIFIK